ncbi:2'-5' RNA ligase family protein [Patescibacteria group bacterium]|nr:2'-5' RNA ligase family protein [Patescibacteria group bacterium]MDE1946738.1 2'-5' RNA ligase family protein [Patescibacteria group bacterium]MDE2010959.1 2'-5' RNA ligase family protein [Patescibacteria group bacterium]MDE2232801.1 2'-5' RNA ligase family protein [Patescibacteria group bacterium]
MRFFVGNIIRGEAAEYYKATCADLSARFGVEDVSAIVPPHITVKSPFDQPNADAIDEILSSAAEAPAIPLALSGWNSFHSRTIFVDAPEPPAELKSFIKKAQSKLRNIGLNLTPQEIDPHIHMSVARFLKPQQFEAVWKHLQSAPAPKFEISFDNLTVFVKENREDRAWKVLKTFPLTGKK